MKAKDLKVADQLENDKGKPLTISRLIKLEKHTVVYNFEVVDYHTYFVSDLSIFVHNKCGSSFANKDLLNLHYEKHGGEFKGAYNSVEEYLEGARDVIKHGSKVGYEYMGETRIGYVKFAGNAKKGYAKFEFVGTNNNGFITTYHMKKADELFKLLNGHKNEKYINPID